MSPILPLDLKLKETQYTQAFEANFNKNNTLSKKTKNKSRMQTNDKSHTLLSPILPLRLSTKKPKDRKYPKETLTIGDEFRKVRLDRGSTQHEVAKQLNVNKNFIYELELNKRKLTIFALHKAYIFLGYIPKTLKIDENTLQGKLFIYRIKKNLTYSKLGELIKLDKSTLSNFVKGKNCNNDTYIKIKDLLKKK